MERQGLGQPRLDCDAGKLMSYRSPPRQAKVEDHVHLMIASKGHPSQLSGTSAADLVTGLTGVKSCSRLMPSHVPVAGCMRGELAVTDLEVSLVLGKSG